MKKALLILAIISVLGIFAADLAMAQGLPTECTLKRDPDSVLGFAVDTCGDPGDTVLYSDILGTAPDTVDGATCCFFSTILYAINWIFMFLMVIVTLFIVLGAFTIVTSGGSEDKMKSGRLYITSALIGLVAALISYALPYIVRAIMGL